MEDGKIIVSIKPELADFCRHEFGIKSNEIPINRNHEIGRFITSHILISETPTKNVKMKHPVEIIPPTSPFTKNHFTFISAWGQIKINDFLQSLFDLRVQQFFFYGYEKKFEQKQIVEAFLRGYNIKHDSFSYEQIKKNDYRKRVRHELNTFKSIQEAII